MWEVHPKTDILFLVKQARNKVKISRPFDSMCIKMGHYNGSSPLSTITTLLFGVPLCIPSASILYTTSIPDSTFPNTTCFPSSLLTKKFRNVWIYIYRICHDLWKQELSEVHKMCITYQLVVTVVMKNWEPLVPGPAFAIERSPIENKDEGSCWDRRAKAKICRKMKLVVRKNSSNYQVLCVWSWNFHQQISPRRSILHLFHRLGWSHLLEAWS